jgi:hypothetical protein
MSVKRSYQENTYVLNFLKCSNCVVQGQLSYYVSQQQLLSQRATEAETHKLHLTHFFPSIFSYPPYHYEFNGKLFFQPLLP